MRRNNRPDALAYMEQQDRKHTIGNKQLETNNWK